MYTRREFIIQLPLAALVWRTYVRYVQQAVAAGHMFVPFRLPCNRLGRVENGIQVIFFFQANGQWSPCCSSILASSTTSLCSIVRKYYPPPLPLAWGCMRQLEFCILIGSLMCSAVRRFSLSHVSASYTGTGTTHKLASTSQMAYLAQPMEDKYMIYIIANFRVTKPSDI